MGNPFVAVVLHSSLPEGAPKTKWTCSSRLAPSRWPCPNGFFNIARAHGFPFAQIIRGVASALNRKGCAP